MMIGEDSSGVGDEKPSPENIQVHLWTIPGKAHEGLLCSSVVGVPALVTPA